MTRFPRAQTLRCFAPLVALATAIILPQIAMADAPAIYVKQATWAETMLASRANYLRLLDEEHQRSGSPAAKPYVSEPIDGAGPSRQISVSVAGCRWMRLVSELEQGGGNCHIWGNAKLVAKDGSVTWLGSLKPVAVRVGWGQLLVDHNWQDHPLRIGEKKFEHGIWVHAPSNVTYLLAEKYERFEAWVGMDADRTGGIARFKVQFDRESVEPDIWGGVAADFPREAKWFSEDTQRRPADWLTTANAASFEERILQHALGQLGSHADALRKDANAIRADKTPEAQRRRLDLYARACRYRECRPALERIWIADLRRILESQLAELLAGQASPGDARWDALADKVGRISEAMGPSAAIDLAAMRSSVDSLKAVPGLIQGADQLSLRLDALQKHSQQLLSGIARGDEASLKALPAFVQETREFRHSVLSAMKGMPEFLTAAGGGALEQEWESQFEALRNDLANRGHFSQVAKETFRTEALVRDDDRDPADVVLRRTAALLADLKRTIAVQIETTAENRRADFSPPRRTKVHPTEISLAALEQDLAGLQSANAAIDPARTEARYALFADACRVRRQIAFCNPLLNFDQLLFIKRHRALYDHMCDQFYGMAARPGGGLYMLIDPFGPKPQVRDVLADAAVGQGRLKGQKLAGGPSIPPPLSFDGGGNVHGPESQGGSFLAPDLSFDGKSVVFAYVQCSGDPQHRHHTDPTQGHWAEGRCFHIFQVNLDGTGLEQLTDGTWNDIDPCWLPNGRIAFISERRGGYLRCGRVCPLYTLYDMAGDGGDINCLSFHDSNEWGPSVTHDGRILYTRWDYVDRYGCTAHLPWITTLDGRDSRAVHGNFAPRNLRPDMELNCRAIPGSHKFVATAAPHHGQAYGSLVLIDPHVADDDGMAPVRRITPEVGFPESQGGAQVYGTACPLSEDYYLCVYDAMMKPGGGTQGSPYQPGNYGIYLVDSFGNRELIYRDPQIACLSPIPVRPSVKPSFTPEVVKRGPESNPATRSSKPDHTAEATLAVVNVYDSLKPWPAGTQIKEIRVMQLLPMSVPSGGPPHETAIRVATAGDSVVPVRYVLGTVPVESDGSAHFIVPAHRDIFFQAVDAKGLAVQSMRSATYLHEGERLVCAGCHEPKHRSVQSLGSEPLAMHREPSRLKPDVDGSNPFSYPRLVQPVLDRHCVQCHADNATKTMSLASRPLNGRWYASYANLVGAYGFHDYGDGYRTTPGKFGARASKLYQVLEKGHYDVKLSAEEMHRLTLWLDCMSMFYGVYEKEGGEAQLRGEIARPTLE